jgi:hypothetical protein
MARKRVKSQSCPNCDFNFLESNNYCPNCGQENHTHKLPLKHFIVDFLEALFHFDTKILSTFIDLLARPGEMTSNFNQNKRNRYVPPFRLYIFTSFIFFLLLAILPNGKDNSKPQVFHIDYSFGPVSNDTAGQYLLTKIKETTEPDIALIDSFLKVSKTELTWYNKNIYRGLVKLKTGHETTEEISHKFYKNVSSLMFFLMPVFAFYLYLIYRRKKLFYTEHLIFSIHFHSLIFLLLCFWQLFTWAGLNLEIYFSILIFIYLLLYMHKVYSQKWLKTFFKTVILVFSYTITLVVAMLIGFILSVA